MFCGKRLSLPTKRTALRLSIKISTGLRNKARKQVLPAWAQAQNFHSQTGEVGTTTEESGLFVDNNDNYSKSSQQTKQQCMATRILLMLELCHFIDLLFKANTVDFGSFKSTRELLFYLSSEDLGVT
mmetsp:Transcript_21878/g.62747  ORF Transcript_21878/g.62747 Transcript_21878/m.62747 type:complete len:127 (-) Transcript_21878:373-753(-)